ncbi:TonB-linked SusC/RagA family outer membrane protein [Chitinophaga dinghuensis]|uniref:TonB-linked SusC/RagA family outer membrane protein n=1 Tax=Chitinophaga dinghuensis TaxID=1539050 RepID=A0A327WB50_9BACT|nr:SusC/RagA family TonB-linked outer membrane protein [Chitinophaga dinghuensis]RAJ87977.1 TonB-linked SusC/RagA family outer membrane protein [Chitinophaga dinghuensis]
MKQNSYKRHTAPSPRIVRWCLAVITTAGMSSPAMALPQDSLIKKILPAKDSSWFGQTTYLWNRTSKRSNMVAATSSIYTSDVNSTLTADITNALTGRLAGLYTVQNSATGGSDAALLYLRGKTPLIVIDGVVRNYTGFNTADIESVTVLKDALATAMFGQRSNNGVVLITTRDRGHKAFEVNASAQYGTLEPLYRDKLLNAYGYATLYNEAQLNTSPGSVPRYTPAMLDAWKNHTNNPYALPDVNWMNEVMRKSSSQQRYNIDLAGTARNYHYYASLEHFAQGGIFNTSPQNSYNTNNDYKRYSIRTNASVSFNKDIELALNVFGSISTAYAPGLGSFQPIQSILNTPPVAFPVTNANGSWGGTNLYRKNPVADAIGAGYTQNTQRRVSADMALTYKLDDFIKGLWVKGQLSMNNYYNENVGRSKTYAVYALDTTAGAPAGSYIQYGSDGIVGTGNATVSEQIRQNYVNVMAGYDHQWNDHHLNLLATFNKDNSIASFNQLNIVYTNAGLTTSYDFNKTYFADLGLVYSSLNRYQPGKRGAFLPSVGLGWVISNENFFSSELFNRLKLRASAGQTAWGDPDGYYPYLTNFTIDGTGYNVGETAGSVPGAFRTQVANPNYSWEKGVKFDIGLEAALLHDQLSVVLDFYRNRLSDLLQIRGQNTGIFGQTYPLENIGINRYTGVEATVHYSPATKQAFKYYLDGNIAVAASKVLHTGDQNYPYSWLYRTGQPVGQLFGLIAEGFYQAGDDFNKTANLQGYTPSAGDIKYKDLNGDGVINDLDKAPIGTTKPLINYGISGGFFYKGFDFKLLIQGAANRNILLSSSIMPFYTSNFGNAQEAHMDRWTPTHTDAEFPRLTLGSNINNSQVSSFWMRNGNYIRLKNVELGYDFKSMLLPNSKITKLRLFVNAYNLFTIKNIDRYDPESINNPLANVRAINGGITLGL